MAVSLVTAIVYVICPLLVAAIIALVRWALAIQRRLTALTWVMWTWIHRQDPAFAEAVQTALFSKSNPDLGGN